MFLGISENAADQKGLLRQEMLGEGSFPELQRLSGEWELEASADLSRLLLSSLF